MPTYEYACAKCGEQFEKFQSMNDNSLTVCPRELCGQKKWGKGKVTRVIGAGAGLIFKGSGFYITDSRSEGYKSAAKKESESKTPPAKTATKAETKAETKTPAAPAAPAKKKS